MYELRLLWKFAWRNQSSASPGGAEQLCVYWHRRQTLEGKHGEVPLEAHRLLLAARHKPLSSSGKPRLELASPPQPGAKLDPSILWLLAPPFFKCWPPLEVVLSPFLYAL